MAKPTAQQEKFIDALCGDAKGNPDLAKRLAGYSRAFPLRKVLAGLSDELIKEVNSLVILYSAKAHFSLTSVLDDPTTPGAGNLINAANSVLDRAGIIKKTEQEDKQIGPSAIIFIPAKLPIGTDQN